MHFRMLKALTYITNILEASQIYKCVNNKNYKYKNKTKTA